MNVALHQVWELMQSPNQAALYIETLESLPAERRQWFKDAVKDFGNAHASMYARANRLKAFLDENGPYGTQERMAVLSYYHDTGIFVLLLDGGHQDKVIEAIWKLLEP